MDPIHTVYSVTRFTVLASLISPKCNLKCELQYVEKTSQSLKPVAHSEIKLKQNTETAWNSCGFVSTSLAIFQHANKYANEVETSLKLFEPVSFSVLFQFYFRMCEGFRHIEEKVWTCCASKTIANCSKHVFSVSFWYNKQANLIL